VPITPSHGGLSGERHKLTNTQIPTSCKKQPSFATQSPRKRPIAVLPQNDAMGHVWTVPALQEESDFSAKRSGAAMYMAYCRLEDYLCRDAATVAAGPDVIR
jgi:hypothetical protein